MAIDVGAHIGTWSLQLAPHFELVMAMEPMAENYDCLLENTVDSANIVPLHVAVGDCIGRGFPCWENKLNSGAAYFRKAHDGFIPMITIDSLNLACVDFIKIDVQGGELDVLKGSVGTLKEHYPVLCVEMVLEDYFDEDIAEFLRDIGYSHGEPIGTLGRDWLWCQHPIKPAQS
jgi:FkbM family methyltransferase